MADVQVSMAHPDGAFTHSPTTDPAFEPNPGFGFMDMTDVHHGNLRDVQRTLASATGYPSFNLNYQEFSDQDAQNGFYPSQNFLSGDSPSRNDVGSFAQGNMDPGDAWMGPQPQSIFAMNSLPYDEYPEVPSPSRPKGIKSERQSPASDDFHDRIPDDKLAQVQRIAHQPRSKVPPVSAPALDKSERARNAANQRHAKSKKARKDSQQEDDSDELEEGAVENKKEKYREKNRVAAAKCRAKKKENVESLEEEHRRMSQDNNMLKRAEQKLRDELSLWKTRALQHNGCNCERIQQYNQVQATQLVFGNHASPMSGFQRRTQSVPGPCHQLSHDRMRHNSTTGGWSSSDYAFAPVATAESMNFTPGPNDTSISDLSQQSSMSQQSSPET